MLGSAAGAKQQRGMRQQAKLGGAAKRRHGSATRACGSRETMRQVHQAGAKNSVGGGKNRQCAWVPPLDRSRGTVGGFDRGRTGQKYEQGASFIEPAADAGPCLPAGRSSGISDTASAGLVLGRRARHQLAVAAPRGACGAALAARGRRARLAAAAARPLCHLLRLGVGRHHGRSGAGGAGGALERPDLLAGRAVGDGLVEGGDVGAGGGHDNVLVRAAAAEAPVLDTALCGGGLEVEVVKGGGGQPARPR